MYYTTTATFFYNENSGVLNASTTATMTVQSQDQNSIFRSNLYDFRCVWGSIKLFELFFDFDGGSKKDRGMVDVLVSDWSIAQ